VRKRGSAQFRASSPESPHHGLLTDLGTQPSSRVDSSGVTLSNRGSNEDGNKGGMTGLNQKSAPPQLINGLTNVTSCLSITLEHRAHASLFCHRVAGYNSIFRVDENSV